MQFGFLIYPHQIGQYPLNLMFSFVIYDFIENVVLGILNMEEF